MKQVYRFLGVFLCIFVLTTVVFTGNAQAADTTVIDTSNAAEGYFTVCYDSNVKMKVGLTFNGKTTYYNYEPGTQSSYAFVQGDGSYTIKLFRNVSGNSYATVTSKNVAVKLVDDLAPYLVSTAEITFAEDDAVGMKAAELCKDMTEQTDKIVAIHNFVAENFVYDKTFAESVRRGAMKGYVPDTNEVLQSGKGVCYDFSALFAAMCRSQGIACTLQKGYLNGQYHAWNMVYVNDGWTAVDMTASISYEISADSLDECSSVMAKNTYRY